MMLTNNSRNGKIQLRTRAGEGLSNRKRGLLLQTLELAATENEREREREREREKERERDRDRDRETDRQTDRQTGRHSQT